MQERPQLLTRRMTLGRRLNHEQSYKYDSSDGHAQWSDDAAVMQY